MPSSNFCTSSDMSFTDDELSRAASGLKKTSRQPMINTKPTSSAQSASGDMLLAQVMMKSAQAPRAYDSTSTFSSQGFATDKTSSWKLEKQAAEKKENAHLKKMETARINVSTSSAADPRTMDLGNYSWTTITGQEIKKNIDVRAVAYESTEDGGFYASNVAIKAFGQLDINMATAILDVNRDEDGDISIEISGFSKKRNIFGADMKERKKSIFNVTGQQHFCDSISREKGHRVFSQFLSIGKVKQKTAISASAYGRQIDAVLEHIDYSDINNVFLEVSVSEDLFVEAKMTGVCLPPDHGTDPKRKKTTTKWGLIVAKAINESMKKFPSGTTTADEDDFMALEVEAELQAAFAADMADEAPVKTEDEVTEEQSQDDKKSMPPPTSTAFLSKKRKASSSTSNDDEPAAKAMKLHEIMGSLPGAYITSTSSAASNGAVACDAAVKKTANTCSKQTKKGKTSKIGASFDVFATIRIPDEPFGVHASASNSAFLANLANSAHVNAAGHPTTGGKTHYTLNSLPDKYPIEDIKVAGVDKMIDDDLPTDTDTQQELNAAGHPTTGAKTQYTLNSLPDKYPVSELEVHGEDDMNEDSDREEHQETASSIDELAKPEVSRAQKSLKRKASDSSSDPSKKMKLSPVKKVTAPPTKAKSRKLKQDNSAKRVTAGEDEYVTDEDDSAPKDFAEASAAAQNAVQQNDAPVEKEHNVPDLDDSNTTLEDSDELTPPPATVTQGTKRKAAVENDVADSSDDMPPPSKRARNEATSSGGDASSPPQKGVARKVSKRKTKTAATKSTMALPAIASDEKDDEEDDGFDAAMAAMNEPTKKTKSAAKVKKSGQVTLTADEVKSAFEDGSLKAELSSHSRPEIWSWAKLTPGMSDGLSKTTKGDLIDGIVAFCREKYALATAAMNTSASAPHSRHNRQRQQTRRRSSSNEPTRRNATAPRRPSPGARAAPTGGVAKPTLTKMDKDRAASRPLSRVSTGPINAAPTMSRNPAIPVARNAEGLTVGEVLAGMRSAYNPEKAEAMRQQAMEREESALTPAPRPAMPSASMLEQQAREALLKEAAEIKAAQDKKKADKAARSTATMTAATNAAAVAPAQQQMQSVVGQVGTESDNEEKDDGPYKPLPRPQHMGAPQRPTRPEERRNTPLPRGMYDSYRPQGRSSRPDGSSSRVHGDSYRPQARSKPRRQRSRESRPLDY